MRDRLETLLAERILVLDGSWGVLIHRRGLSEEEYRGERFAAHTHDVKGDPDLLNLTQPQIVSEIHDAYFEAGADIATTNTFTATSIGQADYSLEAAAPEMSLAGARLAREGEKPGPIRHMCSGFHAASLLLSRHAGWSLADYWRPDHPSQLAVADVPAPTITAPRQVLIRLRAAALNHLDLWTMRGLPGLSLTFPHVLGGDGAGEVQDVGPEVSAVKPGDQVMINPGVACYRCESCDAGEHSLCPQYALLGEHLPGTLAEYLVLPEQNVTPVPRPPAPHPPLTFREAAAFSLVTLTAWRMLITRAALQPGEVVLIWGVGGGVSGAALRIAKLVGSVAIVTSSSDAKLEAARALGADITLNHTQVDVAKEVRRLTGRRGADVVVEHVGAATWEQSLRALAKQGRLVSCGATSGPSVVTDVRRLFWHQHTIMGSTMGNLAEYRAIVRLLGQGQLRPTVDAAFSLADGIRAMKRLEKGEQMGKIVVDL